MRKLKTTFLALSILSLCFSETYAQINPFNKMKKTEIMGIQLKNLSFKSVTALKTMERQFTKLEEAIENNNYKAGANNVKYIKKGIATIKASNPSINVSALESRLNNLEGKIGKDPRLVAQEQEKKASEKRKAALDKERKESAEAQRKERREAEIAHLKKLKSQGFNVSRNAMGKAGPDVKLDFSSSRVWPGVTLHSLLTHYTGLTMSLDGKLQIPKLIFSFLPPNLEGGDIPNYSSDIKEEVMVVAKVVDRKTQKELGAFYFDVNPYQNTFSHGEQHTGHGYDKVIQMKEGQYDLKFYGTGTHFFTLPFKVIKKKSKDPYSVFPEVYFLKGPWENWGYITTDDSKTGGKQWLQFMFYIDYDNPEVESEYKQAVNSEVMYRGTVYRGTTKIGLLLPQKAQAEKRGKNFDRTATATRGTWTTMGSYLAKLNWKHEDNKSRYVNLKTLKDGQYTIVLEVKDAHGKYTKKTFPFQISGGKPIGHSSSTRGKHNDKYTFMESGLGYIFIKAQ